MLRLVVTAYLMLTAALGPWLCCCFATQIAFGLSSLGENASSFAPKSPLHRCCGHHSPVPERNGPGKQAPGGVPNQAPVDHCPCHDQGTVIVSMLQGKDAGTLLRSLASLELFGYASLLPSFTGLSLSHLGDSASEQSAHLFRDARHRLSALQTLRC